MMKKATLADVAALAEVSKATVSRYLKDENVKEDIALRIAKAIEETGYVAKAMKKAVEEEVKIEKKKRVLKKQSTVNRGYRIALYGHNYPEPSYKCCDRENRRAAANCPAAPMLLRGLNLFADRFTRTSVLRVMSHAFWS